MKNLNNTKEEHGRLKTWKLKGGHKDEEREKKNSKEIKGNIFLQNEN